ncbi:MAG: amidohydrolase family protein [Chloroflexota bacterium]|nr:amidohydrolase family protein [Chloroflexota bacterium]
MIIDGHQHFWDLDKVEYSWLGPEFGPINRTFTPAELEPQLAAVGVDRTVLVQSANSFEDTDSMLAHAAEFEWIGAVVGWVPLEDAREAARVLDEKYLANPWFKGIRHLNHDEADPDWLIRPAVIEGLKVLQERGLVYEVVPVYPLHLGHVPALARACPDLTIVVDHLAKPPIASRDYDGWKTDLRAAAEHPNVHAKVSGLNTVADPETWTGDDLVEPIGFAVEVFGAGRLMFGSDWPVAILAGDYAKVWAETNVALDRLGIQGADRAAILGGNAAALYSISPSRRHR